jgi:hypothetical protein
MVVKASLSICCRPAVDGGGSGSDDQRGARHRGMTPNTLVCGRPRVRLDHDAVMRIGDDAPSGGPILWDGVKAMPASGHRHLGSLPAPGANKGNGHRFCSDNHPPASHLRRRPQHDAFRDLAGHHQPPQRDEQLAGQRHNHGFAGGRAGLGWCAANTSEPTRCPFGRSESARPIGSCRGGPGHCRPPVRCQGQAGQALFPPAAAALVGRAGQTAPGAGACEEIEARPRYGAIYPVIPAKERVKDSPVWAVV